MPTWASFTPGPWECRRAMKADNTGGYDYAIAADGKIIAEAFEHVDFADGRIGYEARPVANNARLIAAAPELYRVVDDLLSYPSVRAAIGDKFEEHALSVLAKARGEQ